MKIKSVKNNNRKKAFEIQTWRRQFMFPYVEATPRPGADDPIERIMVDNELSREAFTYRLSSGREGTVHIEQVLEYNEDPGYMRDLLLYKLTVEAQKRVEESSLSKREIIRRLNTSPSQFYRLLDTANYRKSMDKVILLLQILGCDVELVVKARSA